MLPLKAGSNKYTIPLALICAGGVGIAALSMLKPASLTGKKSSPTAKNYHLPLPTSFSFAQTDDSNHALNIQTETFRTNRTFTRRERRILELQFNAIALSPINRKYMTEERIFQLRNIGLTNVATFYSMLGDGVFDPTFSFDSALRSYSSVMGRLGPRAMAILIQRNGGVTPAREFLYRTPSWRIKDAGDEFEHTANTNCLFAPSSLKSLDDYIARANAYSSDTVMALMKFIPFPDFDQAIAPFIENKELTRHASELLYALPNITDVFMDKNATDVEKQNTLKLFVAAVSALYVERVVTTDVSRVAIIKSFTQKSRFCETSSKSANSDMEFDAGFVAGYSKAHLVGVIAHELAHNEDRAHSSWGEYVADTSGMSMLSMYYSEGAITEFQCSVRYFASTQAPSGEYRLRHWRARRQLWMLLDALYANDIPVDHKLLFTTALQVGRERRGAQILGEKVARHLTLYLHTLYGSEVNTDKEPLTQPLIIDDSDILSRESIIKIIWSMRKKLQ